MFTNLTLTFVTLFLIVFGVVGCYSNHVDSYWEDAQPCGSPADDWVGWNNCKGFE